MIFWPKSLRRPTSKVKRLRKKLIDEFSKVENLRRFFFYSSLNTFVLLLDYDIFNSFIYVSTVVIFLKKIQISHES